MSANTHVSWAFLLIAASLIVAVFGQTAPDCDSDKCQLPNCQCSSVGPNLGDVPIPQLVFLSFDAAISVDNFVFYEDVLFGRTNPNGQPITATFFLTHDYTNYTMVHELYRLGHEIGLHSISGNSSEAYWANLDEAGWRAELVDQRQQLTTFARIPASDIVGVRAPQLLIGGDPMYSALNAASFKYDSSRPTQAFRAQGLWPYTNDYRSLQDCQIGTCPTQVHAGFWSVPIINWVSGNPGTSCSLADQCVPVPKTSDETYNLLMNNFANHYDHHRTPFGIFTRHGWVNGTEEVGKDEIWQRRLGYIRFLDYLDSLNDVYIVSIARGLEWVQNPTPLASVADFPSFQVEEKESACQRNFPCNYLEGETPFKPPVAVERWFHSCTTCPLVYPWVGNHLGRNPYN